MATTSGRLEPQRTIKRGGRKAPSLFLHLSEHLAGRRRRLPPKNIERAETVHEEPCTAIGGLEELRDFRSRRIPSLPRGSGQVEERRIGRRVKVHELVAIEQQVTYISPSLVIQQ